MKRLFFLTYLVPLLACGGPTDRTSGSETAAAVSATTTLAPYKLEVTFDGLIAFAQKEVDGNPAVWALLVDADYDPNVEPTDDEVPPCAKIEVTPEEIPEHFPPHVAGLRIRNAEVELNGVPIGGVVPLFFIDGLDLSFDTGTKNPTIDLKPLVSRKIFADVFSQNPDAFKKHDTINPLYLKDFATAQAQGHLAARVLINFGKTVVAEPFKCGGKSRPYGMIAKVSDTCQGNSQTLGESVKVSQPDLTAPITITLDGKRKLTVKPLASATSVKVEVLNILPHALADFNYDDCKHPEHIHPAAFRWFYYLLKDQPTPNDCSEHFFPCDAGDGTGGGTKCPQVEMQE